MKITPTEIKCYETAARQYLATYDIDDTEIVYDHFGIQTLSSNEYRDLKNYLIERSKFDGEIVYHGRRLGKFILGNENQNKLELIEPHPGEVFWQVDCFVEHISFRVEDLAKYCEFFKDRILSDFNVDGAKGFKIQGPSQLLIEFRSNQF
jgi:hypothetical protein